jgi:hypothetical protein
VAHRRALDGGTDEGDAHLLLANQNLLQALIGSAERRLRDV